MRVYFSQPEYGEGLNIYIMDDAGLHIDRITDVDDRGVITVTAEEAPEGVLLSPTLRLGYPIADAFVKGFKEYLGAEALAATEMQMVPLHIWAREADRVDKLIDFAIEQPPEPTISTVFPSRG